MSVTERQTYTLPQVAVMLGRGKRAIVKAVEADEFPKPITVNGRRLWPKTVIHRLLGEDSVPVDGAKAEMVT